ncbi:TIGR02285 family protein [Bdellovibrio sp. HCB2-146]|uniref:TIGR02285 family protein n=1 Tax=Bdellovibrio sp. HCB2-146 TaxID=3394362 RepID=UPI0039BCC6E8
MDISVLQNFFILLVFFLSFEARADVKSMPVNRENEIGWVLFNFPPLFKFSEGTSDIEKSVGPMAEIQRELVKALPQYKHSFHLVTFPRAKKLFESGNHYCTILLLKTEEREQYLYFGSTIATTLPPGLVILRKNENLIKPSSTHSTVDLLKLLQTTNFQLGVVSGRSFSSEVDHSLTQAQKSVYKLVVSEAMGSLFKMITAQRIDGALAYYLELAEEQARNPASRELGFYPLKQDQEILSLPVSCEKSEWGKRTLKNIARAVKDQAVREKLAELTRQTLMLEPPKVDVKTEQILR